MFRELAYFPAKSSVASKSPEWDVYFSDRVFEIQIWTRFTSGCQKSTVHHLLRLQRDELESLQTSGSTSISKCLETSPQMLIENILRSATGPVRSTSHFKLVKAVSGHTVSTTTGNWITCSGNTLSSKLR